MGDMTKISSEILEKIPTLEGKKVLIYGDVGIDEYVQGDVQRINPEAPVPVVEVNHVEKMLGLSANVAANIKSLGGESILVSVVGKDKEAESLRSLMTEKGITADYLVEDSNRPTTAKTRVMSGQHHIVRVDYESKSTINDDHLDQFSPTVDQLLDDCDGVIIQDYAKGMISKDSAQMVIGKAKEKGKLVVVDPYRSTPLDFYKGADLMTPNRDEAQELARQVPNLADWKNVDAIGNALMDQIQSQEMVVTLGGEGMKIFSDGKALHLPTFARNVFDVTGAGDTVVSALTLALSAGWSLEKAGYFANLAAGVVVGQVGAVACTIKDLKDYIQSHF